MPDMNAMMNSHTSKFIGAVPNGSLSLAYS
jgi:hypothetical protein